MDVGTFLLMQSPSARSPQEVYARGIEQAQADAETARAEAELLRARAEQDIALARGSDDMRAALLTS